MCAGFDAEFLHRRNQAGILVIVFKNLPLAVDITIVFGDAAQIVGNANHHIIILREEGCGVFGDYAGRHGIHGYQEIAQNPRVCSYILAVKLTANIAN